VNDLSPALDALAAAASALVRDARVAVATVSDDSLIALQRQVAVSARLLEQVSATFAAEIAFRSRRELGYDGLAQRRGARTPEGLVQQVTGTSSQSARRLVRVGTLMADLTAHDAGGTTLNEPWLEPVLRRVAAGELSAEALDVVRAGLGSPTESISTDALTEAAGTLAAEARTLTLETLAARARELRDELDAASVADRERQRRDARSLRLFPQLDGMTRLVAMLDPESAAVITSAIDAATSPRRGGPRFVDPTDAARAAALVADPRTTEQIALDALVELVDVAVRSRATTLLGVRRADVRVHVTQADLDRRSGVGHIEGQKASVSMATVERHACDGGYLPILFDRDATALNHGRSHRYHDARQRAVIAARDGGCLGPDCDRPPSWCEVHHINEYSKGGETSVDDGVLLCRHHHMLIHNNGWRIRRIEHEYWLISPPDVDLPPTLLTTKSPTVRRMLGQQPRALVRVSATAART
jgi:hypothetical protein